MREAVCAVRSSGEQGWRVGGDVDCGKGAGWPGGGGAELSPWRVRGDLETPDALGQLMRPEEETL